MKLSAAVKPLLVAMPKVDDCITSLVGKPLRFHDEYSLCDGPYWLPSFCMMAATPPTLSIL